MRPALRRIHRWLGLLLALPLALQGVSGCILALADLSRSTMTVPTHYSIGAVVNAAQDAARVQLGDGVRATRYSAPDSPDAAAQIDFAVPNGPPVLVRVAASDGAVLEIVHRNAGVLGTLRAWHEQLLVPALGGRSIVGWFGIALVAMLLTGVPIWWPRYGQVRLALVPDLRARGVLFHRRLHGVAGAWAVTVLMVLAVSGIVLAFPRTTRSLLGIEAREPPRGAAQAVAVMPMPAAEIDHAVQVAEQVVPGAMLRTVFLPQRPGEPVRAVFGEVGASGAISAIEVRADPVRGDARIISEPSTRTGAETLIRWMHDLHTGAGFSAWWHLVAATAGALLGALCVTGCLMWWRKRSARHRTRQKASGHQDLHTRAQMSRKEYT